MLAAAIAQAVFTVRRLAVPEPPPAVAHGHHNLEPKDRLANGLLWRRLPLVGRLSPWGLFSTKSQPS